MENISRESRDDYWTTIETLTAFVRERARRQAFDTPTVETMARFYRDTKAPPNKPPTDIAAVLSVIVRRSASNRWRERKKGWRLNFESAALKGADLSKVDFEGANLTDVDLTGAELRGANLGGAELTRALMSNVSLHHANLTGAKLVDANLAGANLYSANLAEAWLPRANLTRAELTWTTLTGVWLNDADLSGAKLILANLTETDLRDVDLTGADLSAANLAKTTGLSQSQLDAAWGTDVKLPPDLILDKPRPAAPGVDA